MTDKTPAELLALVFDALEGIAKSGPPLKEDEPCEHRMSRHIEWSIDLARAALAHREALLQAVGVGQSDQGPQRRPATYTCKGCKHFTSQYWKDYLDNDDTDSGTSANCTALEESKSITAYWSFNTPVPAWCPCPLPAAPSEDG